jgi:hypothetical protein
MHDRADDLPDMRTAALDDERVEALFRDIAALATLDEIIVKARPGHVDDAQRITLEDAKRLILSREVRGVQIRYRHDGACWWDTLMCSAEGVRLVRVRHEFDAE